jgi:MerR family transcriptional regulator, heat shock protein HspR
MAQPQPQPQPEPQPQRPRHQHITAHVEVATDRGVFMISVAAELAEMHPQTLRMYEARGLVEPKRSPKGTRLYSHADVQRLRRIQEMTMQLGLNLAGVERVLALEAQLAQMREQMAQLERDAHRAQELLNEEIEAVRRSFRAELVPYRTNTALVRASDVRDAMKRRRPNAS